MIFDKDTDDDGVCDDTRYYYCQQANYNVVALTDDTGTVVEKIEYDPYGEYTLILDGSTGNPYLFQGRRWDSEADLYYFRNRSYSPRLGRFMQRDPLYGGTYSCQSGEAIQTVRTLVPEQKNADSLYEYVRSQPVAARDPYGLHWSCCLRWQPMYEISGYDDPICCMRNIIGSTWWGKPVGAVGLGTGAWGGGTVVGGVGGVSIGGAPLLAAGLSIRIALDTCMEYHCVRSVGAQRTVIKKGWIWDTVRYSCRRGVLYEFGQTFSTPPTGPKETSQWE